MKTTKILIALAATATLSLALIGVAYGYYVNNQTSTNTNKAYTANPDFWGWFRGFLGFGPNQPPHLSISTHEQQHNTVTFNIWYSTSSVSTTKSQPR